MRVQWGTEVKEGRGNQYGYYVHNTKLRTALEKQIPLVDKDPTDIIYITSPEYFKAEEQRNYRAWLFTMFEGTTIPRIYQVQMSKADVLLAPSNWVAELFKKYFPSKPIYVINHGVDSCFTFKKRKFPSRTKVFRFLYVGAPNPRKGYEEIIIVWRELFEKYGNLQLYVKTTGPADWKYNDRIVRNKNVILDGRKISEKELVKLYHSAHCFLFPTRGEGFGLTLAEAMRTGLPCIATHYSGVTDFFDDKVGYVIKHEMGKGEVTFIGDGSKEETEIAFPSPDELAEAMMNILNNYKRAIKIGLKASRRILPFTWDRAARILIEALEEVNGANV